VLKIIFENNNYSIFNNERENVAEIKTSMICEPLVLSL